MSQVHLRPVQQGVTLVYYGLYLYVIAILVAMIGPMIAVAAGSAALLRILAVSLSLMILMAALMGLVGKIFCLAAPTESGGKAIIYLAVALDIAASLISLGRLVAVLPPLLQQATNLLTIAAFVLFVEFLRRLAVYIRRSDLADRSANVLKLGVALVITLVLATVGSVVAPPLSLLLFVAVILGLIVFLQYVRLLIGVKDALKVAEGTAP